MSSPDPSAVSGIGQIAVTTYDLARAVRFYRDALGLRFLFETPKLAFFDAGGVRLMLSPPEGAEHDHPGSILYYRVSDIQVAAARLKQRGAECVGEPHFIAKLPDHDLWMAFFKDTEGNTFALMSELRGG